MSEFQNYIQNWVSFDNQVKIKNNELSQLRNQRKLYSEKIYSYVETNSLDNAIIQISDGTLKFQQNKKQ